VMATHSIGDLRRAARTIGAAARELGLPTRSAAVTRPELREAA